jgi:alpha-galactosidase
MTRYREARQGRLHGMDARRIAVVEKEDPALAASLRAEALAEQHEEESGHSGEYGTLIIHSAETGQERVVYGNVENWNSITNLPASCAVEVPCLVDRNGVQPTMVGTLPPQLAALMQTNINVQELTVTASLTGKREHVYQAAMLDPHTAAELDPAQICALVDDLLEAHGSMIPKMA